MDLKNLSDSCQVLKSHCIVLFCFRFWEYIFQLKGKKIYNSGVPKRVLRFCLLSVTYINIWRCNKNLSQPWHFVPCPPDFHNLLGMKVGWGEKEKKYNEVVLKKSFW